MNYLSEFIYEKSVAYLSYKTGQPWKPCEDPTNRWLDFVNPERFVSCDLEIAGVNTPTKMMEFSGPILFSS